MGTTETARERADRLVEALYVLLMDDVGGSSRNILCDRIESEIAAAEREAVAEARARAEQHVIDTFNTKGRIPSKAEAAAFDLLAEIERLRARLAVYAAAATGISEPTFEDERMDYIEVQISREELDLLRLLAKEGATDGD